MTDKEVTPMSATKNVFINETQAKPADTLASISKVNKFAVKVTHGKVDKKAVQDWVSIEEPLLISLSWQCEQEESEEREFTITMRTPGNDAELALGLLNSEGVINHKNDVLSIKHITESEAPSQNHIEVELSPGIVPDWQQYQRHLTTQSSCGVCGKTSLQSLELKKPPRLDKNQHWLDIQTLMTFGQIISEHQVQFNKTGGVHAAALFDAQGELQLIREDVGRHNAMDKLIGANMLADKVSKKSHNQKVVVLSGRLSFELVQKALMATIPVIVAVGAPSSLAIAVAQRFDMTLIGFSSKNSFNIYHGSWRLSGLET